MDIASIRVLQAGVCSGTLTAYSILSVQPSSRASTSSRMSLTGALDLLVGAITRLAGGVAADRLFGLAVEEVGEADVVVGRQAVLHGVGFPGAVCTDGHVCSSSHGFVIPASRRCWMR